MSYKNGFALEQITVYVVRQTITFIIINKIKQNDFEQVCENSFRAGNLKKNGQEEEFRVSATKTVFTMHVLEEKLLSIVPEEGFTENVQEQLFLRMGQGLEENG